MQNFYYNRIAFRSFLFALIFCFAFGIAQAGSVNRQAGIFVISDASDRMLQETPVTLAIDELALLLEEKGLSTQINYNLRSLSTKDVGIVIAAGKSKIAQQIAAEVEVELPNSAESFALVNGSYKNHPVLLISGADVRGTVYGILEIADRVKYSSQVIDVLKKAENTVEVPVNQIRSMTRLFVSDVEDKSWFYDKAFWEDYLSMLISQRFNRFSLTLGLGYDAPKIVRDSYFIFAYPYLVSVPGYEDVKVTQLPEGEQERNLEMLQFISSEAAKRGLHFQLGLWGHAYDCVNSPEVNYTIEGVNEENHAIYCQNAVRTLLEACPDIDGITFRAHHESGIPDGEKSFWETVFQGVKESGRKVDIDLHAKGITYGQINLALDTGLPIFVTPKHSAEHMGLPSHQAAIREMERYPEPDDPNPRNKLARYGYSDFLSYNHDFGVYFRMWPGLQKILLWADPALASGYGRYANYCGSLGMEVCEPLTFKGRQGSGLYPDRKLYADESLIPEGGNFEKYLYSYRVWGRHLYNPDADPESYRRYLRSEFGDAALHIEEALGHASRVTPLMTSWHLPAGSAMTYWPEMYTNMPITYGGLPHPYGDTPRPKVFGYVSPLDPVMFAPVNEFVEAKVNGDTNPRYSPVDVAQWMENISTTSKAQLELAVEKSLDPESPAFRRFAIDIRAQSDLGLFFAEKIRAAVAYEYFLKTDDIVFLKDAISLYERARDAWTEIIKHTKGTYVSELEFGHWDHISGHWSDRLPAIEDDINAMKKELQEKTSSGALPEEISEKTRKLLTIRSEKPACEHVKPEAYEPGKVVDIALKAKSDAISKVKLHYRHVDQTEDYVVVDMNESKGDWQCSIPAEFTDSEYPLMYFFELQNAEGEAWIYPGFDANLANQPYYSLMKNE